MVYANLAKELQNVLPKCNPFAIHIEYHRYRSFCIAPLCQEMERGWGEDFPTCTLTSANAVNAAKSRLSQQQQQHHHWHHTKVIKWFVSFAENRFGRMAKTAAAAPFTNFAANFAIRIDISTWLHHRHRRRRRHLNEWKGLCLSQKLTANSQFLSSRNRLQCQIVQRNHCPLQIRLGHHKRDAAFR